MYRIVVADDEQFIVQLIRQLIDYEGLNVEVIGEAADGNAAFELVRSQKPDILITDIRMPCLDGLQLIEQIREHALPISVIAISGHRRFDYAYNALKYGVHDFIVKPINRKELNDSIAKAIQRLGREDSSNQHIEHIRQQIDIGSANLRRKLLEDCMQGNISGANLAQINRNYATKLIPGDYTGIAIRLDMPQQITGDSLIVRKCCETLDNALRSFADEYMFHFIERDASFLGLINTRHEQASQLMRCIKRMFEMLGITMDVYTNVRITIGIGCVAEHESRIADSVRMAAMASRIKCILGSQRIYHSADFASENWKAVLSAAQIEDLRLLLESGRTNGIKEWMSTVFNKSEDYYRKHPLLALSLGDSVLDNFMTLCRMQEIPIREELMLSEYASINRSACYQDYLQRITAFMEKVREEDRRMRMQRNNYPIECAKNYIAEHLGEPFRLEDIAEKTLLTPSYLSMLFKKEVGETISDYTQKLRLEKAKTLLRTTNLNLNEIAAQVGYTDPKHFSKMFKKMLGVRPQDYRKMYSW